MPFKNVAQKFTASIKEVVIGTGDKALTLGGENVFPLYSFDGAMANPPRVGIEVSDLGPDRSLPELGAFYQGAESIVDVVKRACEKGGADFVSLALDSSDPNNQDKPVEDCVALCKEVAAAATLPLAIRGSGNAEKDAKLFEKVAEALRGKNALILSAKEANYKAVSVSVVQAGEQKVGAESTVDINLAKQLNVLISQLGIQPGNSVMNLGQAAVGYGYEYISSTMDRVKAAALAQNDAMLQVPIVKPVGSDAWGVKESTASEEDYPHWGPAEQRGINMEITTAVADIASGSNAVILRHPVSVSVVKKLVSELV